MSAKIYVGIGGLEIILDAMVDLSQATALKIKYQKPDKTTSGEWAGELVEGTKVKYVTQAGDLDQMGRWKLQVVVTLPAWSGPGETVNMDVFGPFNAWPSI